MLLGRDHSDNRWLVPLGVGINKTFRIGPLPIRPSLEAHKAIVQPDDFGRDSSFRVAFIPIIPNTGQVVAGYGEAAVICVEVCSTEF